MVMAIGLSQYNVALFHTVNHSFFKALLFLAAGAVIHSFSDQQDVRKMGGLIKFLPFTYSAMLVGTLSLLATPFLTGFYSKDLIIELAFGNYSFTHMYAFILGTITAGLTAFYSFRLISLVFLVTPNGNKQSYLTAHESNLAVIIPLIVLSLFSIFFGYLFSDMFVGMGSDFFANSLFIHPNNITLVDTEYSLSHIPQNGNSVLIKLLPSLLSLFGASIAIILYLKPSGLGSELLTNLTETRIGRKLYLLFNSKYYFDVIYNNYIIANGFKLGYSISKQIDRGVIELVGPYGLSNTIIKLAKEISKLDTGIITTYALYITIGFILLLIVLFSSLIFSENINEFIRIIIILIYALFINFSTTVNPRYLRSQTKASP
jgi:NADH-ubiquinone oxidoreductase chain 5